MSSSTFSKIYPTNSNIKAELSHEAMYKSAGKEVAVILVNQKPSETGKGKESVV